MTAPLNLAVAITAVGQTRLPIIGRRGPRQRTHGQPAVLYKSKEMINSRGDKYSIVDEDQPYEVMVWTMPQRSARAELPGQQDLHLVRIGTAHDLSGVDSWSQVDYQGSRWDIVVPPAYHHGTVHVRHWSIDMRRRPSRPNG